MVAILTLLPLSHPEPSQDALFGHFGIYPLLVTLDNSWNMDVIKMAFCQPSQRFWCRLTVMFLPFRVGDPSEAGSDLLLSVIDSQEDSSDQTACKL